MSTIENPLDHVLELGREVGLDGRRKVLGENRPADERRSLVEFSVEVENQSVTVNAYEGGESETGETRITFSKPIWVFPEDQLDQVPKEVFMAALQINEMFQNGYITLGYGTDTIHLQALDSRVLAGLEPESLRSILEDLGRLYVKAQETFGLNE